ncbi:hypothetical protein FHS32_002593 [Streptomyces albaduncus]|uniref:Uncharacterized protein n=1 Tax=Streptomyces griseoloalbus TaxID=67303 RepID=A0A7W8BLY1_9ACTN|nr:hypothetical protein [Streptomyces albaduncus]GGV64687.1 hypothetical protein GCM10010294_16860 [Streptomyces griseoloalbus]GGW48285.1 hypothetical protein GCM10010340_28150 [Streptomyces albaduncus]
MVATLYGMRHSGVIHADIPGADLAAAGRVLALVTERADAELADATDHARLVEYSTNRVR